MRVALLMNFVAPYRLPLFEHLQKKLGQLRILISTPMESDRSWAVEWGSLDVVLQRNLTIRQHYRDALRFSRRLEIHIPYDTLAQLVRYRPDAVISVELGARSLQAALFRRLRPRAPLLLWCMLSEHTERGWGRGRRLVRSWILRQADAVLVNGESGARYLRGVGISDDRIVRVNQPVDVARFAAAPRSRPETAVSRLLCVGMLTKRKGVLPFLQRLAAWARDNGDRDLEIWWLGDGEERPSLAAVPLPANLSQVFCGDVPYAEVPAIYAQCDLLAFPTLLDEWGLVVNEAMAVGLPVIGSRYSQAVEELVEDGVNGWVFDPTQDGSVSGVLDRALRTPGERIAVMRAAARARIAAVTPENMAQLVADAVCAAVERHSRATSTPAARISATS